MMVIKNMIQSDKKIIDAFKTFFDKLLAPLLRPHHPQLLFEWKKLTEILSSEPVEHSKLD